MRSWVATRSVSSRNTCHNKLAQVLIPLKVYDSVMKYVLLAIFVLFTAQPLQGSVCDMHDGQDTSHSQHGNMHENDMDAMDCCDHEPADTDDSCGSMSHCGACTAGLSAVYPSILNADFSPGSRQYLTATNGLLSAYKPPPFRPPIF